MLLCNYLNKAALSLVSKKDVPNLWLILRLTRWRLIVADKSLLLLPGLGDCGLKSLIRGWLSLPRHVVIFLSSSNNILEQYLKLYCELFLPHHFVERKSWLECVDWTHLAQDKIQWRAHVNTVMKLLVPQRKFILWVGERLLASVEWLYLHVDRSLELKSTKFLIPLIEVILST